MHLPEDKKKLDCGDDDNERYAGNGILHTLMRDLNIPQEYRVRRRRTHVGILADMLAGSIAVCVVGDAAIIYQS